MLLKEKRTSVMEGVDPDTLLEWLQTGVGDERDIQVIGDVVYLFPYVN